MKLAYFIVNKLFENMFRPKDKEIQMSTTKNCTPIDFLPSIISSLAHMQSGANIYVGSLQWTMPCVQFKLRV